jgi:hypothetical protein
MAAVLNIFLASSTFYISVNVTVSRTFHVTLFMHFYEDDFICKI